MAGSVIASRASFRPGSEGALLVMELGRIIDDLETIRGAASDTLVLATELKTDYTALLADVTAIRAVLAGMISGSATWDPGNLVDGAGETSAGITATGAALGDFAIASAPYDLQGVTCNAYVDATNSVKIRLQNETGGAVDLASGTWRVRVFPQASFAAPAALTATSIAAATPSSTAINTASDLTAAKIGDTAGVALTAYPTGWTTDS